MQTKPIPEKTNNEWILPSWDVLVKQLFARTEKRKEEKKGELRKRFFIYSVKTSYYLAKLPGTRISSTRC